MLGYQRLWQLGIGDTVQRGSSPEEMWSPISGNMIDVPLPRPALHISAGREFQCALLDDASIACWDWSASPPLPEVPRTSADQSKLERVNLGTKQPE